MVGIYICQKYTAVAIKTNIRSTRQGLERLRFFRKFHLLPLKFIRFCEPYHIIVWVSILPPAATERQEMKRYVSPPHSLL